MSLAPIISGRNQEEILRQLLKRTAGFTPEWAPREGSNGHALLAILAGYLELQGEALDQMPDRLNLSFLNALGNGLLPAHPARAPVVFSLMDTAPQDVSLSAGTRVAAVLPPPPPALEAPAQEDASAMNPSDPEFYTEQAIRLMRGKLDGVYSLDPNSDTYSDHSNSLDGGFTLFEHMHATPHEIYLGHSDLLRLAGNAEIALSFDFWNTHKDTPFRPILVDWEYLSSDGWLPLEQVDNKTERMTKDGKLTLRKSCGPDAKKETISGYESYWIRGRVSDRLPSANVDLPPPGWWIRINPIGAISVGDRVTVDGQNQATILADNNGIFTLSAELSGANIGNQVRDAVSNLVIGHIQQVYSGWRVAVEDGRDFLINDDVTVDGRTQATLLEANVRTLTLDQPISGIEPGNRVVLRQALPPLSPEGLGSNGQLPNIDIVRLRVGFTKADLQAEAAFNDSANIDLNNNFWPFGRNPQRFTTFYIASSEVFARHRARVTLSLTFAQVGQGDEAPVVSAEYFNGDSWAPLTEYNEYKDSTEGLTAHPPVSPGALGTSDISFVCPANWTACEVNEIENHWLRLRLDSGDYGHPAQISVVDDGSGTNTFEVQSEPDNLHPPIVARLRLQYSFFTNPDVPEQCITYNNFSYADHSRDARWPNRPFAPFTPVEDRDPAIHFGFTSRPPVDLISLFTHAESVRAQNAQPLPFVWEYLSERGWNQLSVLDQSNGFSNSGLIQFVGAPDAVAKEGLGGELFRIRARLKQGYKIQDYRQVVRGLWLNALWANQGEAVDRETLGVSNGNPGQTFVLAPARIPVLPGEIVEVREWTGRGEDYKTAVLGVEQEQYRIETDPRDQSTPIAVWVRWQARAHLFSSEPSDRHYVLDPATGTFRFGGNNLGMIPPAGTRIIASFSTGGGLAGNVPKNTITQLRSGVGYVQSVTNPVAATGGAKTEAIPVARDRATERLRHRNRAVAAIDYEWMAREASPEVARTRCLPVEGPDGKGQRGWVRMIVVPHSTAADSQPTLALRERIQKHLAAKMPAAISSQVLIQGPVYRRVAVRAEIVPMHAEESALVEHRVRSLLNKWLHPLTGKNDVGWEFGETVFLSDIASLIEGVKGVDYARSLQLLADESVQGDEVTIGEHELIAPGDHALKLVLEGRPYANT